MRLRFGALLARVGGAVRRLWRRVVGGAPEGLTLPPATDTQDHSWDEQQVRIAAELDIREAAGRVAQAADERIAKEAQKRAAKQAKERAAKEAEERATKEAEERATKEAEERAAKEAEERAAKEAEERAAKEAEERAAKEAEERATKEAEARAAKEAEERAAKEAEERAAKEAKERATKEAEERAAKEAEERAAKEAEERAAKEAEERAAKEAEERAAKEAEERAAKEAEERAAKEEEERAAKEEEERAAKEEEERAAKEAEERAAKEAEERAAKEAEERAAKEAPRPVIEVPKDYVPAAESEHQLYQVSVAKFEGPLDLLLFLIRRHALDVFDIPIAFICSRYLECLKVMDDLSLDVASEFLAMAAELLHIKSKMLLPKPAEVEEDQDEGDPRAELVRRLLEYQKYKSAAEQLSTLNRHDRDTFGRTPEELPPPVAQTPLAEVGLFALVEAFDAVLKRQKPELRHRVMVETVSVRQRMQALVAVFAERASMPFVDLFSDSVQRMDIVLSFLAVLEMTRLRLLRVYQSPTGELYLEARFAVAEQAYELLQGADVTLDQKPTVLPIASGENAL